MRRLLVYAWLAAFLDVGCGGGSTAPSTSTSTPTGPSQVIVTSGSNVLPVSVNLGPVDTENIAFATVTVCVPGSTTNCLTIPNIQIDTGSSGLRILSSALSPASGPPLSLPQQKDSNGNPIVECLQFVSSYSWGPVQTADVQIAGEQVHNLPIQVIGAPAFPAIPNGCSSTGPSADTVQTFGAYGLLGVGSFQQDCGPACASGDPNVNPDLYYSCPTAGTCLPTVESVAQQVQNPVWLFSADNNGVIVELPPVAAAGQALANGSLVFGIGTQSNNALGTARVIPLDPNSGTFTTTYAGQPYTGSFFDTGSDAFYFLDSGHTGLGLCQDTSNYYCPASTQILSASIPTMNGTAETVTFNVGNADTLFSNGSFAAFSNLGGPNPGTFDWGLPFFYGRNMFFAIESQSTSAGVGPYVAY